MLCALVLETISGIVLYVGLLTRVGRLLEWSFLGLDKLAWEDLHTLFGLLMILSGLFHLLLNLMDSQPAVTTAVATGLSSQSINFLPKEP